jgi:hypothetical protein
VELHALHVEVRVIAEKRCGDQLAVEVVRPGVVRTNNGTATHHAALEGQHGVIITGSRADARAAVAADVVERPDLVLSVTQHEDAFAVQVQYFAGALVRNFFFPTHANPLAHENVLTFECEVFFPGVPGGGEGGLEAGERVGLHVGIVTIFPGGFQLGGATRGRYPFPGDGVNTSV